MRPELSEPRISTIDAFSSDFIFIGVAIRVTKGRFQPQKVVVKTWKNASTVLTDYLGKDTTVAIKGQISFPGPFKVCL